MISEKEKINEALNGAHLTLLYDGENLGEVSEEFSLPDYQAEVSRIVCVRPQFLLENKYIHDTGSGVFVDFGGTVTYSVIYISSDGELCAVPLSSSYENKIALGEAAELCKLSVRCESTSCRVSAPRRLTIKTKLRSHLRAYKKLKNEPKISPASSAEELFLERNEKAIEAVEMKEISLKGIKMSEALECPNGTVKPIWCDAFVSLGEVKVENGYVKVSGDATVKCLITSETGEDVVEKTMKISEQIEADGAEVGDFASVNPVCTSLSLSSEEKDGETGLYFDLTCDLVGEVIRNTERNVLADAYSTKHKSFGTYKELEYYRALGAKNASFTVCEEKKRSGHDGESVVLVMGEPIWEKTEVKGTKAYHLGKLNVSVIMKNEDAIENERYSLETYELPIKFEEELGKAVKSPLSICDFTLGAITVKQENERAFITAEVNASTSVFEKNMQSCLSELTINTDEEIKNERSCVRVCFPREGETLWDVSKRYNAPLAKLASQNELDKNATELPKYLII